MRDAMIFRIEIVLLMRRISLLAIYAGFHAGPDDVAEVAVSTARLRRRWSHHMFRVFVQHTGTGGIGRFHDNVFSGPGGIVAVGPPLQVRSVKLRSESSAPEDEIDKLLAKLRVGVSSALRPHSGQPGASDHQTIDWHKRLEHLGRWPGNGPDLVSLWPDPVRGEDHDRYTEGGAGPGITKERLMAGVYFQETNDWPELKILDIRIHHIRNKLLAVKAPYWIETVHGALAGYCTRGFHEPRKATNGASIWSRGGSCLPAVIFTVSVIRHGSHLLRQSENAGPAK